MTTSTTPGVKLVVFDWTGTLIDHGCVAPVQALQATFGASGLCVTKAQIRGLLGLPERELIERLLSVPSVQRSFAAKHARAPGQADVEALYTAYVPAQLTAIRRRSELIDGAVASFAALREQQIAVATTCCYFRAAVDVVLECARQQELVPDFSIGADDVPAGRPAPFMIQACMQALGVQQARDVLVVGDTALDVQTARNAGCLSTGIAGTGHDVGLSSSEWDELTLPARNALLAHAHRTLRDAGADFVIDNLSELPLVIRRIAERGIHSAA